MQPFIDAVKLVFRQEFAMVIHRAKKKYFPQIASWRDTLL
jgi:hypothetical protein